MEIRTIDGKDYLVSSVIKEKWDIINTTKLFNDMLGFITELRKYNQSDFVKRDMVQM